MPQHDINTESLKQFQKSDITLFFRTGPSCAIRTDVRSIDSLPEAQQHQRNITGPPLLFGPRQYWAIYRFHANSLDPTLRPRK